MDPLAVITSIITLSKTLQSFTRLITDFASADETVRQIKVDCELANGVLLSIQENIKADFLPTELTQNNSRHPRTAVNLTDLLLNNVQLLQQDVSAVLKQVEKLDRSSFAATNWILNGAQVVTKQTYLKGMQQRIHTRLVHLELVKSNLLEQARRKAALNRRGSNNSAQHVQAITTIIGPPRRRSSVDPYLRQRLIDAVRGRKCDEAEKLLEEIDPNFPSDDNERLYPLQIATMEADMSMINLLLYWEAKTDCSRAYGNPTPLMIALEKGEMTIALTLISRGADVNQTDSSGRTPLHICARKNYYDIVKALLRNSNIDLNAKDADGRTPLFECVRSELRHLVPGDVSVLRILLEHVINGSRADPTIGRKPTKETPNHFNPLHLAAQQGYVADLEVLVQALRPLGIDVDSATTWDCLDRTALWYAASTGQVEAIKLLLRNGASANRRFNTDQNKPTALWAMATYACARDGWENRQAGLLALINAGAKPDDGENSKGYTLLTAACEAGNPTLVQLLLSKGADPTIKDPHGWQPVHHAAKKGDQESVALLLKCEAYTVDINAKTSSGDTPLILAAMNGHDYLVRFLERYQPKAADWGHVNSYGSDAFYLACATGHTFCAAYLLALGADMNRANRRGNTPLSAAARRGHFDTVLWLLRMGVDREARVPAEASGGDQTTTVTPDVAARTSTAIRDPGLREAIASLIQHWTPDQARSVMWAVTSEWR